MSKKIDINNEKYLKAKELYLSNKSLVKTCKEVKMSRRTLTRLLIEEGIDIINYQNISRVNEDVFEVIDTEEKAYWLGFLYADGCVYDNKIECTLKRTDIGHLIKLKEFLNYTGKIEEKNIFLKQTQKEYFACRLCFRNSKITRDLKDKGCIPRKSLVLKFPTEDQVPNHLIKHFVRGYFDGDGFLGIKRLKNGELLTPRIAFLGTLDILNNICKYMDWEKAKLIKDKRSNDLIFSIEFGGNKYFSYLDSMYSEATIYLDRKYELYKKLKANENEVEAYIKNYNSKINSKIKSKI